MQTNPCGPQAESSPHLTCIKVWPPLPTDTTNILYLGTPVVDWSNPMNADIHGHEVMNLIHQADPPLNRATLREAVLQRWGDAVRFRTCAAEGMNLDGLLQFLSERGKVVEADGVLRTDIGQMCEDG